MNNFLALPAPAADGAGAWVDCSTLGGLRTINVDTPQSFITVEGSNESAPTTGFPIVAFQGSTEKTVTVAARWMRAVTSNYKSGSAPVVGVGSTNDATSSVQLNVPASDGHGTSTDTSSLATLITAQVLGAFSGTVNIEVSEDGGTTFETAASFQAAGGKTVQIVANKMRVSVVGSNGIAPQVWIGATSAGGAAPSSITPLPFVTPAVTRTIYARPSGSDTQGTGTLANPYATMQRAVLDVPLFVEAGVFYNVDMTGCTEVLPANYTLPEWKAPWTTDSTVVADPNFLFVPAVNILAIPQLATAFAGTNTIPVSDVISQTADPVSGLIRVTFTTNRAAWAANALRGYLIEDSVGGGNNCVIWQSDATHLVLCTAGALDVTAATSWRIVQPGATIRGTSSSNTVAVGSARGCLRAINCDSVGFSGLDIANSASLTAPGLALGGNGSMFAQMCWLQSPTVQAFSPALGRHVRCWIKGSPSYSNFVTIQQSLCDTWTGSNWLNLFWMAFRGVVFDACAPIDPQSFFPGIANANNSVMELNALNVVIANTPGATGDGIRFHGAQAQLSHVDIYNCGRNGILANAGAGRVQLTTCGTTSADGATVIANAASGISVQDGMVAALDATTYNNTKPLHGTTQDILSGNLAGVSMATFAGGTKNLLDITAVAAGGATGTGSRVYGD